jgi:hypothetical protein
LLKIGQKDLTASFADRKRDTYRAILARRVCLANSDSFGAPVPAAHEISEDVLVVTEVPESRYTLAPARLMEIRV